MTQKITLLVWTCLFVFLPIALTTPCPSREDIAPCTCEDVGALGAMIKCYRIDNDELAKVARNLRGMKVWSLNIEDSKLGRIPYDVFKGVKLNILRIERSTVTALTDRSEAFVGLDDHLKELEIYKTVFNNDWDWSILRNLKKLTHLTNMMSSLRLDTLGTDVMKFSPSLEYFSCSSNNASIVSDQAFESYRNIGSFTISNNKIKSVKRTMLPNPALKLSWLDFHYNMIEQFPEDMFTNMPNLNMLDIRGNKILALDEKTFSPVFEKLDKFFAYDNALRCDCRMSWLLKKKFPIWSSGECESPPELKGRTLDMLSSRELNCHT